MSRNHVNLPPTKGRLTKKFLAIKSKNLNMVGLKEIQPSRSTGYLMMLKSPKTPRRTPPRSHTIKFCPQSIPKTSNSQTMHAHTNPNKPICQPRSQFSYTPFYPKSKELPLLCEYPKLPNQPIYKRATPKTFLNRRISTV